MAYAKEPAYKHGSIPRTGVLLVNLGTPAAATAKAVRRYLKQFLSDPRVVEIPPAIWKPLLHGVVLRVRPAQSAERYLRIWTKEGSPLFVHSEPVPVTIRVPRSLSALRETRTSVATMVPPFVTVSVLSSE